MSQIKDISPSLDIPTNEDELHRDQQFQETPLQSVGGLQAGSRELTHGKIRIAGVEERIYFGDAVDVMDGTGIFMGKVVGSDDEDYYDFRFGDPSNDYIRWDEETKTLTVKGQLDANDIVTGELSASRVLISGSTSLDDWRSSSDATYIDGGQIYTDSVTTSQVNFTIVDEGNVVGTINASTEGIEIEGDTIELNGDTVVQGTFTVTANDNVSDVASGADVTNNNTANDTDYVNGTTSSTVESGADRGYNAINSSYRYQEWLVSTDMNTGTNPAPGTIMDSSGIRGYNSSGTKTFEITGDAGNAYFKGTIGASSVDATLVVDDGNEVEFVDGLGTTEGVMRAEDGIMIADSYDALGLNGVNSVGTYVNGNTRIYCSDDVMLKASENIGFEINNSTFASFSYLGIADFNDNTIYAGDIQPDADDSYDLGSGSDKWQSAYIHSSVRLDYDSNAYISQYDGSSSYFRFKFNSGGGDIEAARTFKPNSDNTYSLGTSSLRWSNLYTADISFDNEWVLTESYKIDIEEEGMALVDDEGELKYFFGEEKFYTPQNVDKLDYTQEKLPRETTNPPEEQVKEETV